MYMVYVYCVHMVAVNLNRLNMKMVTLYLSELQYQVYQKQAQKQGKKTAELIREAMDYYSESHFNQKKKLSSLTFDRGVTLKSGATDFIKSDWRSDFLDSGVKL